MPLRLFRSALCRLTWPALVGLSVLGGCSSTNKASVYQQESFDSDTYSRSFLSPSPDTCEAARRALLSQGYVIDRATPELVNGRKSFQPGGDAHVQIQFYVVCTPASRSGVSTILFVNALQDRYSLRKSNNSATLGVSAIGSVSLPVSSSDDSLVKVASETIPAGAFYDRFFTLVDRYLTLRELEDASDNEALSLSPPRASAGSTAVAPAPVVVPVAPAASGVR
ncbi:uncharacterized protein DUF2242 [Sphaerotilus hippei]|uniref:Uncharacterized protein DUF2242 n=1 Tax=Sphaerotilus hippei TaxID=744406 RepID=A0A318H221_9BURK|nr:DUF2242 domain-containing protein [Sphaerotilus hippei]PXW95480.1 uncharacterized protein DUF2242 [Sphaerotilus hippei]